MGAVLLDTSINGFQRQHDWGGAGAETWLRGWGLRGYRVRTLGSGWSLGLKSWDDTCLDCCWPALFCQG